MGASYAQTGLRPSGAPHGNGVCALSLSTLVLISIFILDCAGFLRTTARRIEVSEGAVAAATLLTLALSAVQAPLAGIATLNLGFCLALLFGVLLCRSWKDAAETLVVALCAGALGFGVYRLTADFYEPGLLACLPAAGLSALLLPKRRSALLAAVSAPVFFAVCVLFEDIYLFDAAALRLANPVAQDMQTMGAALSALLWPPPGISGRALRILRERS